METETATAAGVEEPAKGADGGSSDSGRWQGACDSSKVEVREGAAAGVEEPTKGGNGGGGSSGRGKQHVTKDGDGGGSSTRGGGTNKGWRWRQQQQQMTGSMRQKVEVGGLPKGCDGGGRNNGGGREHATACADGGSSSSSTRGRETRQMVAMQAAAATVEATGACNRRWRREEPGSSRTPEKYLNSTTLTRCKAMEAWTLHLPLLTNLPN